MDEFNIAADVSALRARVDLLDRKVEFLLSHLSLTYDEAAQAQAKDAVAAALRAGDTIKAIALYREATGVGLKDAKVAVEAMAGEMGLG